MIAQLVPQLDFLGVEKRRRELSAEGDPLEVLARAREHVKITGNTGQEKTS